MSCKAEGSLCCRSMERGRIYDSSPFAIMWQELSSDTDVLVCLLQNSLNREYIFRQLCSNTFELSNPEEESLTLSWAHCKYSSKYLSSRFPEVISFLYLLLIICRHQKNFNFNLTTWVHLFLWCNSRITVWDVRVLYLWSRGPFSIFSKPTSNWCVQLSTMCSPSLIILAKVDSVVILKTRIHSDNGWMSYTYINESTHRKIFGHRNIAHLLDLQYSIVSKLPAIYFMVILLNYFPLYLHRYLIPPNLKMQSLVWGDTATYWTEVGSKERPNSNQQFQVFLNRLKQDTSFQNFSFIKMTTAPTGYFEWASVLSSCLYELYWKSSGPDAFDHADGCSVQRSPWPGQAPI